MNDFEIDSPRIQKLNRRVATIAICILGTISIVVWSQSVGQGPDGVSPPEVGKEDSNKGEVAKGDRTTSSPRDSSPPLDLIYLSHPGGGTIGVDQNGTVVQIALHGKRMNECQRKSIVSSSHLELLDLEFLPVRDDELVCLKSVPDLQHLLIGDSANLGSFENMTDEGMKLVGELTKLSSLQVCNKHITDEGIAHLSGLENLEELIVDGTKITNNSIDVFGNLPKLKTLSIKHTELSRSKEALDSLRAKNSRLEILVGS